MSAPLLDLKDLHKRLQTQLVLKGVNLEIHEGENMVIIGRSGGGKSVLLRHIMGLLRPDKGHVFFRGRDLTLISEENLTTVRREMGMLFQNGALFDSLSVGENVAFSLREEGKLSETEIKKEVARALKIVDLPGQENKMPSEISGGMKKRAGLARAMALDPDILFFDEPSAGLDPISSRLLDDLILELRDSLGATIVVVTHELASLFAIGSNSVFLDPVSKRMIASGNPKQLLAESEDPRVLSFLTRGEKGMTTP